MLSLSSRKRRPWPPSMSLSNRQRRPQAVKDGLGQRLQVLSIIRNGPGTLLNRLRARPLPLLGLAKRLGAALEEGGLVGLDDAVGQHLVDVGGALD